MADRKRLITDLATALTPVSPWSRPGRLVPVWLLFSLTYVCGVSLAIAPWRPGAIGQMLAYPQFLLEILAGIGAIGLLAVLAFASAVPGRAPARRLAGWALVAVAPWLGLLVLGLWYPALEPTMSGKRSLCYFEVLLESLPPLGLGLLLARRLYPLRCWVTGALVGAVAGALPALVMQLACMYIVPHGLSHHLAPVLGCVAVGAMLGAVSLRRPER